jgi:hypothetical protein
MKFVHRTHRLHFDPVAVCLLKEKHSHRIIDESPNIDNANRNLHSSQNGFSENRKLFKIFVLHAPSWQKDDLERWNQILAV